ncbi:MAG: MBL fold metallo-hydrolase [Phycisphaerales bacterium]|nr:MAG: MBL fold metallo-hydrolase [Phycisphaerales bacterium]
MHWSNTPNTFLLFGACIAVLFVAGHADADFTFGTPTNLGPMVNSSASEYDVCISADGLLLVFGSPRPGGVGDVDMWVTTRATINDRWEEPLNLGPPVNSEYSDSDPSLSTDGHSLFFRSNRPGGCGGKDLWLTTRLTEDDSWTEPVNLGSTVNSSYDEGDPSISADSLSLYFSDYTAPRPGGQGGCDIWVTTRPSTGDRWGEPVNLGSTVNSASNDFHQSISADGLTLFFCSNRSGGLGDYDLYMTRRATTSDPWGEPENLGPTVNTVFQEANPEISYDGSILYFDSTRPGGSGGSDLWQAPIIPTVDFNGDQVVDFGDLSELAQDWLQSGRSVDIAPPIGDGIVDLKDLAVFAQHWRQQYEETLNLTWFAHASVKIWTEEAAVYVDPRNLSVTPHDATLVLVTHTHGDHYQPSSIARVSGPETIFIAPPDVVQQYGQGQAIAPGETIVASGIAVTAVPSYNTNKPNHPKSNNWVGFIVELAGRRTYVAGDTDLIPEMQTLGEIDAAFLPAGGTYTMNAVEAAEATAYIQPDLAIPYHWGTSVGSLADAETFAQLASCAVKIMSAGETLSSDNWPVYSPLVAHFALDETEGTVAHDSVGGYDGALDGDPVWQPAGGKVGGALQLDGDDHVTTPFVLNPGDGPFSVFAWIKGGAAGDVFISQTDGTGTGATWLGTEPAQGMLMTTLTDGGRFTRARVGATVVTGGDWHEIGLVWDGSARHLYVDGSEDAVDTRTLSQLKSCDGGLNFGADNALSSPSMFSGLLDEIRIYNRAVTPESE